MDVAVYEELQKLLVFGCALDLQHIAGKLELVLRDFKA